MNEILYRIADSEDVVKIKELTDVMLKDTMLGVATTNKIERIVNSPSTFVMLAFDREKLVGCIAGVVHQSLFNDITKVTDVGLFVLPEYRKSKIGFMLIKQLEQWARYNKASQIWLGQTTGNNPERIAKMYERLGYTLCGFNSVKEI